MVINLKKMRFIDVLTKISHFMVTTFGFTKFVLAPYNLAALADQKSNATAPLTNIPHCVALIPKKKTTRLTLFLECSVSSVQFVIRGRSLQPSNTSTLTPPDEIMGHKASWST